jgi:hypothetical protein
MEGENRLRGEPERNEIDRPSGQFRLSFWAEACSGERRGNATRPPLRRVCGGMSHLSWCVTRETGRASENSGGLKLDHSIVAARAIACATPPNTRVAQFENRTRKAVRVPGLGYGHPRAA